MKKRDIHRIWEKEEKRGKGKERQKCIVYLFPKIVSKELVDFTLFFSHKHSIHESINR